jgi:hypothetical protein
MQERGEDIVLLALKVGKGPWAKGCRWLREARKDNNYSIRTKIFGTLILGLLASTSYICIVFSHDVYGNLLWKA